MNSKPFERPFSKLSTILSNWMLTVSCRWLRLGIEVTGHPVSLSEVLLELNNLESLLFTFQHQVEVLTFVNDWRRGTALQKFPSSDRSIADGPARR